MQALLTLGMENQIQQSLTVLREKTMEHVFSKKQMTKPVRTRKVNLMRKKAIQEEIGNEKYLQI